MDVTRFSSSACAELNWIKLGWQSVNLNAFCKVKTRISMVETPEIFTVSCYNSMKNISANSTCLSLITPILPLFSSFPFPTCCEVLLTSFGGNGPHWGDDWSHSHFIRLSPSESFLGFSSAVRQMPGDLCTDPGIISWSHLTLATNVTYVIIGASCFWPGAWTGACGTATLA